MMKSGKASLWLLPIMLAGAAPAAATPLRCALALIPPEASRELAERYERDGTAADFETAIPQQVFEQIGGSCVDLDAPDAAERGTRLGQSIMAWQLMHIAADSLVRHHNVSSAALDEVWSNLPSSDRARLADFGDMEGEGRQQIILRLALRLRPDLERAICPTATNEEAVDRAYVRLVEDLAIYGSSRALLEQHEGQSASR